MRAGRSWRRIEGAVFDGRVRVGPLLSAGRDALFAADWVGIRGPAITVRVFPESAEPLLERHLEASFLEHPNMLRCFGAGEFEHDAAKLIYTVLGRFDETLAQALSRGALAPEEALQLGRQLSSALAYLHHCDLVFCNLDPAHVVCTNGVWQLGDYTQLRAAGRGYAAQTRRLAAIRPSAPPEACEGLVTPQWDSWGLACVLSAALTGQRREIRPAALPEPFETIVAECLHALPQQRCGVARIRMLLGGAAMAASGDGSAALDPVHPRPPYFRPIRYLSAEARGESDSIEPAAPPATHRGDGQTTIEEWWSLHGVTALAAAVATMALLVLLFLYLPNAG